MIRTLRAFSSDLWRELPLYFVAMHSLGMANLVLNNLDPPEPAMLWTMAAPLAVFLFVQESRIALQPSGARGRLRAWLWGVTLGLVGLGGLLARPFPLSDEILLVIYEYANLAWVALLIAWMARQRPASHLVLYFGALLCIGTVLENGGILMGFFAEHGYHWTLPGMRAPLATQFGWCMVMVMGLHMLFLLWRRYPALERNLWVSAAVAALCVTALDVQIDPLASRIGCWVWNELAPPLLFDVPLINFVAWMSALVPTFALVLWVARRNALSVEQPWPRRAIGQVMLGAPISLGLSALLFWGTMTVFEGGFGGPSWRILRAFLGAA